MRYIAKPKETEPTKLVELSETSEGVDITVGGYFIAKLSNAGTLLLYGSVGESTGLTRDKRGFVKVTYENNG